MKTIRQILDKNNFHIDEVIITEEGKNFVNKLNINKITSIDMIGNINEFCEYYSKHINLRVEQLQQLYILLYVYNRYVTVHNVYLYNTGISFDFNTLYEVLVINNSFSGSRTLSINDNINGIHNITFFNYDLFSANY